VCSEVGCDHLEKAVPVALKEAGLDRAEETVSKLGELGAGAVTFILHQEHDP